jgi:hypothetical protein
MEEKTAAAIAYNEELVRKMYARHGLPSPTLF